MYIRYSYYYCVLNRKINVSKIYDKNIILVITMYYER